METNSERRAAAFRNAIISSFVFLKKSTTIQEGYIRSIPLPESGGVLLPISTFHRDDGRTIGMLSRWREQNQDAFPTRFNVTEAGTARWMQSQLLDKDDRILFLVLNRFGEAVGHLGFANCLNDECSMEVDNVIRGTVDTDPGIMTEALAKLLEWARTGINVELFTLRVLSDNSHAIRFYERCGFSEADRIPLRKESREDSESLEPIEDSNEKADAYFVRMRRKPSVPAAKSSIILTAGPSTAEREASYAWDAARNGWNSEWNKYHRAFEQAFSNYIGVDYCLPTSSCTGALHIALSALEIGPGDEVIVPDITWVATANAVQYVGATPVFADIEADSWCLDPQSLRSKISERTRAVIPVHLYGHPSRMDAIEKIAREAGIFIVEDAAPAIGTEWKSRRMGTYGDFACFSFQGAKLLVTGEGGALVTKSPELYERAKRIWDQGRDPTKTFWINSRGLKYKMSNIQAALGVAQLESVEQQIEMKRRIFDWYHEDLASCPHIDLMQEVDGARSIYWMTNIRIHEDAPIERESLRDKLRDRGIDTRPVFPAISQYPIWQVQQEPMKTAQAVGRSGINLPSGVCLTRDEVRHVAMSLRELVSNPS